MGVSQNQGYLCCGPYKEDYSEYSILGSILGSPYLGKPPYSCRPQLLRAGGHVGVWEDIMGRVDLPDQARDANNQVAFASSKVPHKTTAKQRVPCMGHPSFSDAVRSAQGLGFNFGAGPFDSGSKF